MLSAHKLYLVKFTYKIIIFILQAHSCERFTVRLVINIEII